MAISSSDSVSAQNFGQRNLFSLLQQNKASLREDSGENMLLTDTLAYKTGGIRIHNASITDAGDRWLPPGKPTSWKPTSLRRVTLTILACCLLALLVVLEVLHRISKNNQGLMTVRSDLHYLWTYGPTAGEFGLIYVSS